MIRAKYLGGSSVILPIHNDIDYYYFCDTREERLELVKNNKDHSVDNHYRTIEQATKLTIFCYIYPFMQLIEGEEIKELTNFSIFDHKNEYIALLKKYINRLDKKDKHWYHILVATYMFKNVKMKLTKKQLENVVLVHNQGINDELYSYIIANLK